VVAQTTQNLDDYNRIVRQIKKISSAGDRVRIPLVCQRSSDRRKSWRWPEEMDAMFVVGGKNSANTRRLADLASKKTVKHFHIETPMEIEKIDLDFFNRVGVSAGASTPNWILDRVMDKITEGQSRKFKTFGALR
jgi:4-hydroxy-3-methylbut-2-enyl diphosphate reductase